MDKPKYKHKSGAEKRSSSDKKLRDEAAKKCRKVSDFFGVSTSTSSSFTSNPLAPIDILIEPISSDFAPPQDSAENNVLVSSIPVLDNHEETEVASGAKAVIKEIAKNDFPSDYALFKNVELSESIKLYLVRVGACQPQGINYPKTKNRSFSEKYFEYKNNLGEKRPRWWLSYSPQMDVAYCHNCWLFGKDNIVLWKDWGHLSNRIEEHCHSKSHIIATTGMRTYLQEKSIDVSLKKQYDEEQTRWKEILKLQFDLLRTITSLTLPLRGHSSDINRSDCGVYLTFIKFLSKYYPPLEHHLKSEGRIKYLSPSIMEEQVRFLADITRCILLDEVRNAVFWTIIVDSTTDISKTDQVALIIRYVHLDHSNNIVSIKEIFLEYLNLKNHNAPGYVSLLLDTFKRHNLNTDNMVGQAYDGASVMSGGKNGVHILLRKAISQGSQQAFAPYVHCPPHQLNLVLSHAAEKCASIQTLSLFGNVQKCYKVFADSPQRRWAILKETCIDNREFAEIEGDENKLFPQKEKVLTLKNLSSTRWSARAKAIHALLQNFQSVITCLEQIVELKHDQEEVTTAAGLLNSFSFEFLVILTFWNDVLQIVDITSKLLQQKEIDLFQMMFFMKQSKEKLCSLRNDTYFDNLLQTAQSKWLQSGMDEEEMYFQEKRSRRKKTFHDECAKDDSITNVTTNFKVNVINVTLDAIVTEMTDRIEGLQEVTDLFGFLNPAYFRNCNNQDLEKNCAKLSEKFKFISPCLTNEMIHFKDIYFNSQKKPCVDRGTLGYLEYLLNQKLVDIFPNIELLLRLFITLPIGVASAERSFSVLRRLKSYLRSTMTQERTSNLTLLSIEKDVLIDLNLEDVANKFMSVKVRRGVCF